jgi:hypothetical protein
MSQSALDSVFKKCHGSFNGATVPEAFPQCRNEEGLFFMPAAHELVLLVGRSCLERSTQVMLAVVVLTSIVGLFVVVAFIAARAIERCRPDDVAAVVTALASVVAAFRQAAPQALDSPSGQSIQATREER